jgi:hypothetical protein
VNEGAVGGLSLKNIKGNIYKTVFRIAAKTHKLNTNYFPCL